MLTIKFRNKDPNFRMLIRVEDKLIKQLSNGIEEQANMIVADIRSSWSASSPSAGGSPPAVVSGVLDASVTAEKQGRSLIGRFMGKDAEVWYVRVDTSENDDRGASYGAALEDPDYLNRPYVAPALDRAAGTYASTLKRFVRL